MGNPFSTLFGAPQGMNQIGNYAGAPYNSSEIQNFLPPELRQAFSGPALSAGMAGLTGLLKNPGGLNPNISEAIAPWLRNASQSIATNYRNLGQNSAGAAARSNLPVSIKDALQAALGMNQVRDQFAAKNQAMGQSEQLRREDISQLFPLLMALHQFTSTGRGQAIQGYSNMSEASAKDTGSKLAAMASIAGAAMAMSNSRFKKDFELAKDDDILDAIKALPVYKWSYKGEETRHIGPMAEEFMETFGTGDNPDVLPFVDAIGTLMAATKALASKVERMEARV